MYRHPKTTQEIRNSGRRSLLNEDGYEVRLRAKRRNLPTAYDDIHRSDINTKSWKKNRKTQYKI